MLARVPALAFLVLFALAASSSDRAAAENSAPLPPARAGPCPAAFDPLPSGAPPAPITADARAEDFMTPAWEIRPASGRTLTFSGIVDQHGNTYWTESVVASGATELGSATRGGAIRFHAPASEGTLALAGRLLVSAATAQGGCRQGGAPVANAYSTSDGSRRWHRDLLPIVDGWMRRRGACRYGAVNGFAVAGGRMVIAVSVLDRDTAEHESGYVALDSSTGAVLWSARTSPAGNVMASGPPRFAEDGTGYGSRTVSYERDELLVFAAGAAPRASWVPTTPWHGAVLAASGTTLVTQATGGSSWSGPPRGVELRCRATGERWAGPIVSEGVPLLVGRRIWLFGDQLVSYDAGTGQLLWRVALATPAPAPGTARRARSLVYRSAPIVTRGASVLFTEQRAVTGPVSSAQELGTPYLREIDAAGREVLRRRLPAGREAYDGPLALYRGRVFVGGQVLPAAGAHGIIRAFDVPGRAASTRGWFTPSASAARDNHAR